MKNYFTMPGTPAVNYPTHKAFIDSYCKARGVLLSELKKETRIDDIVFERQSLMYLLVKNYHSRSFSNTPKKLRVSKIAIGLEFNKNHATVCYSEGVISDLVEVNKKEAAKMEKVIKAISIDLGIEIIM